MQSIGTAALVISTSYLVAALGWRWWYGVFGIVSGVVLISSFLFIPESLYHRPTDAFEGTVHVHHKQGGPDTAVQATVNNRVELDFVRYQARSLKDDLKILHGKPNWKAATDCYYQMAQCILFPNILWVVLMNSAVLGIYVVMVTEFAGILVAPPYKFPFTSLGFVQGGQIVVSILLVPILGWGGDLLTRVMAKRNNGLSEPENRLIPILLPSVIVIISCIIFGKAGSHPTDWSPWAIITTFNAEFFGFIGIVLIGFTYSLDCYGERAAPILVLICAFRGLASFGISFGVTNFVLKQGYEGSFNVCAIVMGVVSALGFPIFFFGKKIRSMTMRYAVDHETAEI
jgi:Major Facilitator Superfamily